MIGREPDSDARPYRYREPVQREGVVEGVAHPVSDLRRRPRVGPIEQSDELVATDPREQRPLGEGHGQAFSDLLQKVIADVVAERVVDLLEAVEIDEQEREAAFLSECGVDRLVQLAAVGEPGQLVGVSLDPSPCEHGLFAPSKTQADEQRQHRREHEYVADRQSGREELRHEHADYHRREQRRRGPAAAVFAGRPRRARAAGRGQSASD